MINIDEYLEGYRQEGIQYLKSNVPEIKKLESLDELHNLKLTQGSDLGIILVLKYEAKAPELFPAVRQRLIDKSIAKRHNFIGTRQENKGTPEETYMVHMGFYGSKLQIVLTVHK